MSYPGKTLRQVLVAHVAGDGFSNHLAEVRGQRQIAAFVELRLVKARPASVDFAALHRAAQNEHYVGVAVVGAAIAVLARRASELRHRDDDGVFAQIAEIDPERGERLREVAEHIRQLAFRRAFVDVMVPARRCRRTPPARPRFALINCASCRRPSPKRPLG